MRYSALIFFISAIFFGIVFSYLDFTYHIDLITGFNIFGTSAIITLLFIFQYYYKRRNGNLYGIIDIEIFKIILEFLKEGKYSKNEKSEILKSIFKSYSPVLTDKLFNKFINTKVNLKKSCISIKNTSTEAKYFVLHALFDISSRDRIISEKEELFIDKVRRWMYIHKNTLNAIKQKYINAGIQLETDLKYEEQKRRRAKEITKTFLPYNAYKTLGVSPSVTKSQLKKAYRTLAKKYHPDKFHGQDDAVIQEMEDKFHEITEAYEIVKRYLK